MVYKCEICGSPHDTEGGLVSHLQNKEDDAHAAFSSRKLCWKHVMERNGELEVPDPDPEPEQPEQPEQPTPAPASSDECPECGSDRWHAASEVLQIGDYDAEEAKILASHERVCAACNEVYST